MSNDAVLRELLTSDETAAELGVCKATVLSVLKNNPGFGFRFANAFRIPRSHVERVKQGENPADIAAQVRAGGAPRAA